MPDPDIASILARETALAARYGEASLRDVRASDGIALFDPRPALAADNARRAAHHGRIALALRELVEVERLAERVATARTLLEQVDRHLRADLECFDAEWYMGVRGWLEEDEP